MSAEDTILCHLMARRRDILFSESERDKEELTALEIAIDAIEFIESRDTLRRLSREADDAERVAKAVEDLQTRVAELFEGAR